MGLFFRLAIKHITYGRSVLTVGMTSITRLRIITVTIELWIIPVVLIVHIRLVMFVTVNAGEDRRIASCVAFNARQIMITVQREGMVKTRRRPGRGRVTVRTIVRQIQVVMVLSTQIIGTVARITIRSKPCIGASRMTHRAIHPSMTAG